MHKPTEGSFNFACARVGFGQFNRNGVIQRGNGKIEPSAREILFPERPPRRLRDAQQTRDRVSLGRLKYIALSEPPLKGALRYGAKDSLLTKHAFID